MTRARSSWLFLSPALLLLGLFFVYPLLWSIWLSLHTSAGPDVQKFVGMQNYAFVLRDKLFWLALLNTAGYTLLYLLIQIPASMGLALLLNGRAVRAKAWHRFVVLLPVAVGQVFVAVIFSLLLAPRHGAINQFIALFGGPIDLNWRSEPMLAIPALVLMTVWLTIGYGALYLLAAMQGVDEELYEAARLDGAGKAGQFRHVTLPGVRPVLLYLVLVGMIGAFQLFELPFIFFGGPGPGFRGLTVVMYLYMQGFQLGNIGYAAAIGWALVVCVGALSLVSIRLGRGRP